ncbi:MAG TPA: endonuclease III, partial [Exilispira sp.]|nr:endonuclease III [Exilispira sp.]
DSKSLIFDTIIPILEKYLKGTTLPAISLLDTEGFSEFELLISTILSARTKDDVTYKAARKLFEKANTPVKIMRLSEQQIIELIYPVGFYKTKAKNIKKTSAIIHEKYNDRVPDELEELLKLPGVGRKTANLVIAVAFKKNGLCVDTHVHRISNRLGIIKARNPEETEMKLREILPKKYWEIYNRLLVSFGQNICKPISPFCNICPISSYCKKIGVRSSR